MVGRPKHKAASAARIFDRAEHLGWFLFLAAAEAKSMHDEWMAARNAAIKAHIALEELVKHLHEAAELPWIDWQTTAADRAPEEIPEEVVKSAVEILGLAEELVLAVHATTPEIYREKYDDRYPVSCLWWTALASVLRTHQIVRERLVRVLQPDALQKPSSVEGIWPAGCELAFHKFMEIMDGALSPPPSEVSA
jgi:hypothetical protein